MPFATLAQLRTRVRQRSDNEFSGSNFITDDEITQLLNTSYQELYGLLERSGLHLAEELLTITADGSASYDLPADYYATLAVFRVDGNYRTYLPRHSLRVRPSTAITGAASSYRVVGSTLVFLPTPTDGTYEVIYIPVPGELSADEDTVDGVLGWEEYLVIDCAIKILEKEESDVTALRQDRERIQQRIIDEATAQEMSESWTVNNVRYSLVRDEGDFDRAGYRGPLIGYSGWRW